MRKKGHMTGVPGQHTSDGNLSIYDQRSFTLLAFTSCIYCPRSTLRPSVKERVQKQLL